MRSSVCRPDNKNLWFLYNVETITNTSEWCNLVLQSRWFALCQDISYAEGSAPIAKTIILISKAGRNTDGLLLFVDCTTDILINKNKILLLLNVNRSTASCIYCSYTSDSLVYEVAEKFHHETSPATVGLRTC